MGSVQGLLFALLSTSLVVLELLALSGWGPAPGMSILSAYALFGASSIAVQYVVGTRQARARLFVVGILAGAGAVTLWLFWRDAVSLRTAARGGLALAGLTGIAGYLGDALVERSPEARRAGFGALRDAALVPLAVMQVPFFLWATTGINPVFDARVLAVEASLGVNLSALTHALYDSLPLIGYAAMACYLALPIGLALVVQQQPTPDLRLRVLVGALAAGAVGFALYAASPVVGIFPAYPAGLPDAATVAAAPMVVLAEVPRNGMPSLHTAWALLIALNAWRLPGLWRPALVTFAALNVYAAAGAVGHWALDIIVAVPMAAAVQLAAVPARAGRRAWTGVVVCAAITLGWTAGLRAGITPHAAAPVTTGLLLLTTVAVPAAWLRRGADLSASGRR